MRNSPEQSRWRRESFAALAVATAAIGASALFGLKPKGESQPVVPAVTCDQDSKYGKHFINTLVAPYPDDAPVSYKNGVLQAFHKQCDGSFVPQTKLCDGNQLLSAGKEEETGEYYLTKSSESFFIFTDSLGRLGPDVCEDGKYSKEEAIPPYPNDFLPEERAEQYVRDHLFTIVDTNIDEHCPYMADCSYVYE